MYNINEIKYVRGYMVFKKRLVLILLLLIIVGGCTAYKLDSGQENLRASFSSHQFDNTVALLKKMEREGTYKAKDRVLFNLEMGTATHFAAKYDSSNMFFSNAEDDIDELFTKSVSQGAKSLLLNDNSLAYDGEDYEDVYLNIFKGLNYIKQGELESALVETRRVSYKLEQLNIKYKGLVETLAKADSTGKGDWKMGKSNIQNSALGHYLSTILFAKTGKPDDARISFENLTRSFADQQEIYSFKLPERTELEAIKDPGSYNILIAGFAGRGPHKTQNDTRIYLKSQDLYLKFSLPVLKLYSSSVRQINVIVDDSSHSTLHLIEEMDHVAKEVYKVKEPIIYARTLVRASLKAIGSNKLSDQAAKQSKTLGRVTNLLGKIGQEVTEKADLRSWQTMPGKAYAKVLQLPPGNHNVQVNYISETGTVIFTDEQTVSIPTNNNQLALVESIYWN